jgi:hypothetical protein
MPDSPGNLDHLFLGPSGVLVIDSKQWTGPSTRAATGRVWHNHYHLARTLATSAGKPRASAAWAPPSPCSSASMASKSSTMGCPPRAWRRPRPLLRSVLGYDRVLSDTDVERMPPPPGCDHPAT